MLSAWDQEMNLSDSLDFLRTIASHHARMGGDVGQRILSLLERGDYKALISFADEAPLHTSVSDVSQYVACRQALAFFEKLEPIDIGIDKEAAAFAKFTQSEVDCRSTNDVFRSFLGNSSCMRDRDVRVLYAMRRKIGRVLGVCPPISRLPLRLGPGATTATKRADSCVQMKFASQLMCTETLLRSEFFSELMRSLPHLCSAHEVEVKEADGYEVAVLDVALSTGRLSFVPKNAKTYRAIVTEPLLNSMLQLGIGDYMARRLQAFGIDLADQTRNRALARLGSITQQLATLDLSSASDTISTQLVKFLLPEEWFRLLNAARSHSVTYGQTEIMLQKFSSMGNGFTFPLESLIFWALCVSSLEPEDKVDDVGVYGDDLIVPSRSVASVSRSLSLCGFSLNMSKSFWEGDFRESCGADYLRGFNVRPVYQKHLVSCASLFVLHNFFYRLYDYESCKIVLRYIPNFLRLYGPDGYGDGHLLGDWSPHPKTVKLRKKGYGGVCFETYRLGSRRFASRYPGDYVSPLYHIYRRPPSDSWGVSGSTPLGFTKSGRPLWGLPGTQGYSKTLIYTLAI